MELASGLNSATRMAPLWRTAWRRMRRRPIQYVLLVVGVALGVAMIVSIDLANGSASRAFQLSTDAVVGRTTHRLVGGPAGLDEEIYRRVRAGLGYAPAAPVVEGYLLVREFGDQPVRMVGVDPFAEPPFRSYFGRSQEGIAEGLVAFLTEPNSVLISQAMSDRHDVELGDTVLLDRGGELFEARIVGLLDPADEASRRALDNLIFTDISSAQAIFDMFGRLSHIDLIAEDERSLGPISEQMPAGVRLDPAAAQSNTVQQLASAFQLNLTSLSLLALVVGMFLIYNTVTFSVVQRRRLFGILRCLGVTGGQLFTLILAESLLLGLIGAILGLGAGLLLGKGMVRLVSQTISDFYFVVSVREVTLPVTTLLKGLAIGVAAAGGAALAPAWEALRTSPQSGLHRSALESKVRRLAVRLLLPFVLLALLGAFLLWIKEVNIVITFAGLFTVLIAFAFVTPALTSGLMHLVAPASSWAMGIIGKMAPRDIRRALSRTSVAIAALMIAVSVIIAVSVMIGSFRVTVVQWLSETLQADIFLSPPTLTASRVGGTLDLETVDVARSWPGVERTVIARQSEVQVPELGRPVEVIAVDGDVSNGRRSYAWVDGSRERLWSRLADGQGIFISEPLVIRNNLAIPPAPLTLLTETGPREFPVLAIFYDYASDRGSIIIHQSLFEEWWGEIPPTTAGLFVRADQQSAEIAEQLRRQFSGRADVIVQSNESVRGNALDIFDRTFAITGALQLLAVIVAFIGILSALLSLQLERTREIGVLRATGMTIRQLWQLTLFETGIIGGVAGLLAMPIGLVLAWIVIFVINRRSFGWTLQMHLEPIYFLEAFAVALLAATLAGIYPAWRSGRLVIATAIREE